MKTRETTPGKTYSVHTSSGCTVSDKNGWSKTIDAPDGYFTAHAGEVTIDGDDAADVREVFKLAPQQRLALLGVLGGGVPVWFKALKAELTALLDGSQFEVAWLAGKNTLVVHTDRVSDELLAAVKATAEAAMPATATLVQYNHNMEISWRDINKYAACKTPEAVAAVNSDYATDLTSDGEWVYPLPNLVRSRFAYSFTGLFSSAIEMKKIKIALPKAQNIGWLFNMQDGAKLEEVDLEAPATNTENNTCYHIVQNSKMCKKVRLYLPNRASLDQLIWSDYVEELDLYAPKASTASKAFDYCRLNKKSAVATLNGMPAYTAGWHPLDIGIHIDHRNDEEVLAAIANAEAKGWTLTVKWKGTPTAQASTMAMGSLIYSKIGEYELPDGTTERYLDWGHYVTNPEGYETFRSLASAYRYFGLTMPEETT